MARILIDSSVWIEYYRPGGEATLREAVRLALTEDRVVTTGVIVVEVLQGAKTEAVYDVLGQDFSALPWVNLTPEAAQKPPGWGSISLGEVRECLPSIW